MFKFFDFVPLVLSDIFHEFFCTVDHLVSSWLLCWFYFNLKCNDLEPMVHGFSLRLLSLAQSSQHL